MPEDFWQSEMCGFETETEEDLVAHEEAHEIVLSRDGGLGQYLAPTLVDDVSWLLGDREVPEVEREELVPRDVRDAAARWNSMMGPGAPEAEPSEEDFELVLDWWMYHADEALARVDLLLWNDDGYMIFREPEEDLLAASIAAHPANGTLRPGGEEEES
jgi:hypothetical protein